jgi:hypothetical protein
MIRVELPYPHKALWPNGRAHWAAKAKQTGIHRHMGAIALRYAQQSGAEADLEQRPIPIKLVVHPKAKGPLPDADNCAASIKAYLDGIADALKVNDKAFGSVVVQYNAHRTGVFVIEVG